ncbi:hypothetical protein YPPY56_2641, partial [Yersinia pestis PY-56]
MFPHLTDFV